MSQVIQLDDLREEIIIQNKHKKVIGKVYIRSDDYNILNRAKEAEKNIEKAIKEAEQATSEAGDEQDDIIAVITDIDKKIKEEIDYLFDYPVSKEVFGNTHCLSTRNGKYFVENFLDSIMPVIEQTVTKEVASSQRRMDKYLKEYTNDHLKQGGTHR